MTKDELLLLADDIYNGLVEGDNDTVKRKCLELLSDLI